jgi:hypothetical protein
MASPGDAGQKFDLGEACDVLSRTPAVLNSLLSGLPDAFTSCGTEDNWAPFDVVGHLIHGELTDWIPRARIILEQRENRTFAPFYRLAQFELQNGKSLSDLLIDFHRLRHESLETLQSWNLTGDQLALEGIHPELGSVTLAELLASWVAHDMTHTRQIVAHIAKQFGPFVGPWKEYLSILN